MKLSRRALAALAFSFLAWSFVVLHIPGPPGFHTWSTILMGGDHWSHVGQTALFLEHGFDLYKHPQSVYCTGSRATPESLRFVREDACPGDSICNDPTAASRPLCIAWNNLVPAYPPGLFLYSIPDALLYLHTQLSFAAVNLFSVLKYLLAAHLLLWILFKLLFAPPESDDLPGGAGWESGNPWLRWALYGFLYLQVIKFTLAGFYDALALFPMFLGIYFLEKRRSTDALVALAAALFLQYRALWYLPLFAAAALGVLREQEWTLEKVRARVFGKLAIASVLIAVSGYAFLLFYPALWHFPNSNPVHWHGLLHGSAAGWNLIVPEAIALLYLGWGRRWLLFATVAWQLVMIVQVLQIMPWHVLFLLPLFPLARLRGGRGGELLAVLVVYLTQALTIFGASGSPFPGELVSTIASFWGPLWPHALFTP